VQEPIESLSLQEKSQEGKNLEGFKGKQVLKSPNRQKISEIFTLGCLVEEIFQKTDWTVESLQGEVSICRGPVGSHRPVERLRLSVFQHS
jgi:hypothetical protein